MVGIITSHSGLRPEAKRYVMAGRGVVVDKGGRGDFTTITDAVNYMAARGSHTALAPNGPTANSGRIWIRNGHYKESVDVDNLPGLDNIILEGESWNTFIDGTDTNSNAVILDAQRSRVMNLVMYTPGAAGLDGTACQINNPATFATVHNCWIVDSDNNGIATSAGWTRFSDNEIQGADAAGIRLSAGFNTSVGNMIGSAGGDGVLITSSGGSATIVANVIYGCATDGVEIDANGNNCCVVGNNLISNTGEGVDDNSGTSTVIGNETS